jgi:hypothetical protein
MLSITIRICLFSSRNSCCNVFDWGLEISFCACQLLIDAIDACISVICCVIDPNCDTSSETIVLSELFVWIVELEDMLLRVGLEYGLVGRLLLPLDMIDCVSVGLYHALVVGGRVVRCGLLEKSIFPMVVVRWRLGVVG